MCNVFYKVNNGYSTELKITTEMFLLLLLVMYILNLVLLDPLKNTLFNGQFKSL